MPRTARNFAPWLALCLCLSSACGQKPEPQGQEDTPSSMSVAQAQQIVEELRSENGFGSASVGAAPTSLAEVRDIVANDQLDRFEKARQYATRLTGSGVLALRASLEAVWADTLLTTAHMFEEAALRTLSDIRTLRATAETLEEGTAERLIAEREQRLEKAQQAAEALEVLAQPHLQAAKELSSEAQRQNPDVPGAYEPGAHAALLTRSWVSFDRQLRKAESLIEQPTAYMAYLRALEQALRFSRRDDARDQLTELLDLVPELNRARARLILLEDAPETRHAHLEALEERTPNHPLATLAGPAIEREFRTSQELGTGTAASATPVQGTVAERDPAVVDAIKAAEKMERSGEAPVEEVAGAEEQAPAGGSEASSDDEEDESGEPQELSDEDEDEDG